MKCSLCKLKTVLMPLSAGIFFSNEIFSLFANGDSQSYAASVHVMSFEASGIHQFQDIRLQIFASVSKIEYQ